MTTTWSLNAGQLITQAYRKIGSLASPWTLSEDQLSQGIIALNALLKGNQIDGINIYRQEQVSLAIPAGMGYFGNPYDISPLVLGLEEARLVIQPAPNLYERPLAVYSYDDYANLPNKRAQGSPSLVCLDKQVNASSLYIWPLPINGCVINATIGRTVNDVNSATDPLDFPTEWTEGMIYCLADRIMDDNGVAAADPETATRIAQHAIAFYKKLLDFDRPTSIYIRPWGKAGQGKFWR